MMNMLVCKVIELNNSTYYHLICTGDATVSYENVNLTTNSSYFMNSTCTGTEFNLAESSPKRTCSFACSKNTIRCYGQYKSMHIVFSFLSYKMQLRMKAPDYDFVMHIWTNAPYNNAYCEALYYDMDIQRCNCGV